MSNQKEIVDFVNMLCGLVYDKHDGDFDAMKKDLKKLYDGAFGTIKGVSLYIDEMPLFKYYEASKKEKEGMMDEIQSFFVN